ncbi:MAG: hypothetical protein ACRDRY_21105 [Pseudonocardiaceae bacterium]
MLLTGEGFEPPVTAPEYGVHDAHESEPGRPTVGIVFYRAHELAGNTGFVATAPRGRDNALPVFCGSLRGWARPGPAGYGRCWAAATRRSPPYSQRAEARGLTRDDWDAARSFNTINKWALGIADTLALSVLTEAIGFGLPIVLLPFVSQALAAHPAWETSVATLRTAGVTVLLGCDVYEPHAAGEGKRFLERYPWDATLATLVEVVGRQN